MQMIRHHDPSINFKWPLDPRYPNCLAQNINVTHQQVRPAMRKIDSKEICPARNIHAAISAHLGTVHHHS